MDSFSDVFERVKQLCRGEMSEVAYDLWIRELELTAPAQVVVLERIRYANGIPVSIECHRLPVRYLFLLPWFCSPFISKTQLQGSTGVLFPRCPYYTRFSRAVQLFVVF